MPEAPSGRVEILDWGWLRQVGGVGRVRSTSVEDVVIASVDWGISVDMPWPGRTKLYAAWFMLLLGSSKNSGLPLRSQVRLPHAVV